MGHETNPMPVVNGADDESYPTDFQYVTENVETSSMSIDRVIISLQVCKTYFFDFSTTLTIFPVIFLHELIKTLL